MPNVGSMSEMPNVTSIEAYRDRRSPERDAHLRRLALQLVVQLPTDSRDALDCLDMAKIAVCSFLGDSGSLNARLCQGCKLGSHFGVHNGPDGIAVNVIRGDTSQLT